MRKLPSTPKARRSTQRGLSGQGSPSLSQTSTQNLRLQRGTNAAAAPANFQSGKYGQAGRPARGSAQRGANQSEANRPGPLRTHGRAGSPQPPGSREGPQPASPPSWAPERSARSALTSASRGPRPSPSPPRARNAETPWNAASFLNRGCCWGAAASLIGCFPGANQRRQRMPPLPPFPQQEQSGRHGNFPPE